MKLSIRSLLQTASAGNHVTIYDGELTLKPAHDGITVSLQPHVGPHEGDPESRELARLAIKEGAEAALAALNLGATIVITRLLIHPTDFKPWRYKALTKEAILKHLSEETGEDR